MNRENLIDEYKTPQKAAQAIVDGKVQLAPNDFEALGPAFEALVIATKLGINVETAPGK